LLVTVVGLTTTGAVTTGAVTTGVVTTGVATTGAATTGAGSTGDPTTTTWASERWAKTKQQRALHKQSIVRMILSCSSSLFFERHPFSGMASRLVRQRAKEAGYQTDRNCGLRTARNSTCRKSGRCSFHAER
jgi:hypothetical protein